MRCFPKHPQIPTLSDADSADRATKADSACWRLDLLLLARRVRSPLRSITKRFWLLGARDHDSPSHYRCFMRRYVSLIPVPVHLRQEASSPGGIQRKLTAEYSLIKVTSDKTDIVTAGAVLVLEKDNLLMYAVTSEIAPVNTYKNGKISHGIYDAAKKCTVCAFVPWLPPLASKASKIDQRTFFSGEKFRVTEIEARDDSIVFDLLSDPYDDMRYDGQLKFPFPKGSRPSGDAFLSTVSDVIKVQPDPVDHRQPVSAPQPPQGTEQQQVQTSMPPIAAPPPPPDAAPAAPKTIEQGQTKEVVVAILGQPSKVIKLGTKEVDVYPDIKVTYMNDKVADVQ